MPSPAATADRFVDHAPHPDPLDLLTAEHGLLRAACAALERLATAERAEPEAARALAAQLRAILPPHTADEAGGAAALSAPDRAIIGAYAGAKLRHLILETAVLMPLARERVPAADRALLARGMAPRRPQEATE